MSASNWFLFGPAVEAIADGTIDLDNDTFRIALVTSSWTPDQSADDTWSDLSANEVANGNGYATHGKVLTQGVSRSGLVVTFDGDDQSWTSSTITAKYAVLVRDANADGSLAGTDLVIAYCDLNSGGGSVSTTAGTLSLAMNASGMFTATAATAS